MRQRISGRFPARNILSGSALLSGAIVLLPAHSQAGCSFPAPVGDDVYVCDSGTLAGDLDDVTGNNQLLFPEGGSGTIDGNVAFGTGNDAIQMQSGAISGAVDQGSGTDSFVISGGLVGKNVQQGSGIDDFQMSGGEIGSLNQGDNLDTFFMSGGRIVDFFDDGDHAVMTGGRIGRVNMKLDNNTFDMSGGAIDKNLVAGFGNDTIILSAGTIGGNISVSGGSDSVTVTGGTVGGEVRLSAGEDDFTWDGGGIIYGRIDLGGDNDTASLANLTSANIGATPQITGGLGDDTLTFDNTKTDQVARLDSWEEILLTNDTELTFEGILLLGDTDSGSGSLRIDATSTVYGGGANGGIAAFLDGALVEVANAGRIDLTNGSGAAGDTFTIGGNYAGEGGQVFLNTALGTDSSISDRLMIGGDASGTTGLNIVNTGGIGGVTQSDGIMVVEVSGTSATSAFALNGRVAAGAYEYYLFKGGVSDNSEDNWYLRSTVVTPSAGPAPEPAPAPDPVAPAPADPQPEEPDANIPPPASALPSVPLPSEGDAVTEPSDPSSPVVESDPQPEAPPAPPPAEPSAPPPPPPVPPAIPAPVPGSGGSTRPPSPGATAVIGEVVPLYRIEVPTYAAVPPIARHIALSTLGTFHERRGEQALLHENGWLPASWARVFGQDVELKWDGTVSPGLDARLLGLQAGQDVFDRESENGHRDRLGLFLAHTAMDGDITGQALGWNNLAVGSLDVAGTSFGGYWTHIGPQGWFIDGVAMATRFSGSATSKSGVGVDIDGTGITASLEGGYPLVLSENWTLEPQAQLIWSHISLDDQRDRFSSISFDLDDQFTGRLGVRIQGLFESAGRTVRPYLKANLWHSFSAEETVRFGNDPITTETGGTTLELGGGIVADLTDRASLFVTADYTTELSGGKTDIIEGNLGLAVEW